MVSVRTVCIRLACGNVCGRGVGVGGLVSIRLGKEDPANVDVTIP